MEQQDPPQDPTTRAVLTILEHPTFDGHEDRFAHFSGDGMVGRWWDFGAIIGDWLWSGGQHIALRCAEAIYRGTVFPGSDELVRMDYDLMVVCLQAQRVQMGMEPGEVSAA